MRNRGDAYYHVADVAEGLQGICHIIYLWFRVLGNGCRCVCGFYEIRRLIVSTSFKLFDNAIIYYLHQK